MQGLTAYDARRVIGQNMIVKDNYDLVMDLEKSHGHYIVDARDNFVEADGSRRPKTMEERTVLDMYSQFASWPVGYNHPKLVNDKDFLARLTRVAINKIANSDIVTTERAEYVDIMRQTAMPDGLDYLFLITGGALAVENALKAAFDWKIRLNFARGILIHDAEYKVAHFRQAFHGRSGYTMSLTNTDPDKIRFFPKFDSWPRLTNPTIKFPLQDHLEEVEKLEAQAVADLEEAIAQNPHTIACVILETIQGEGGDNYFRPEFFQKLREITEQHDILFIFDEVQTGCGMTGKFWAYQHYGVVPDILCFGKKMQTCGILGRKEVFDRVEKHVFAMPGRINSTWGSDLVDMVRATQLLKIIRDDELVKNAATVGAFLLEGLQGLQKEFSDMITNARGLGLMAAFDFIDPTLRAPFTAEMWKNHVMTLACGPCSIRLRPMLDVQKSHIEIYLEAARKSLRAVRP